MASKASQFTNDGTFDGLSAQLDVTLPNVADDDFSADIQLSQSGVAPDINVVFAIDRSGSTSQTTGIDYNGDGSNDTFLEAQIFALEEQLETLAAAGFDPNDVTITIVDYAGSANSITRTLADQAELLSYANGLSSSGTTNYAAALSEAEDALDAIPGAADDTNILYFYSDGRPVPSGQDFQTPLNELNAAYDPATFGVAFGPNAAVNALGIIDDSGSAQVVLNEQDLEDLVNTPPPLPDVENFEIFVDGVLVDTLVPGVDAEVVANPTGFTITGLDVSGYTTTDNTEQTINVEVVVNFTNGESLSTNGPVVILDGVVEGTAGADLIDVNYEDDPEGDKVDNHDNVDDTAPMDACDDDVIDAAGGDDTIDSGLGNDTVDGGAGDDLFLIAQEGNGIDNDVLIGGETDEDDGGDTVDTSDIDDDLTVTFTGDEEGTITDGTDTTTFEEMENIQLGGGDDSVTGGDGNENVDGGAGDDTLDGGDGNDTLAGGDGEDEIDGGAGNDVLDGGEGDDTITGGAGNDTVTDLEGNNVIDTSDPDLLTALPDIGFPGYPSTPPVPPIPADSDPNNDRDLVTTGDGNDSITTGDDADTIISGGGEDTINAGIDDDSVDAGAGADLITTGEGNDTVDGGDGNDTIFGGLGPTVPDGINIPDDGSNGIAPDPVPDNGKDLLDGGRGNDLIFGEDDDDTLIGGIGDDTLDGGIDDDSLQGDIGFDSLIGGQGNDTLDGGRGRDTMLGGEGNDVFIENANEGADRIDDFNVGNTGSINDGDQTNNDFVDLSGFYNDSTLADVNANATNPDNNFATELGMLRADAEDGRLDGVINGEDLSGIIGGIDLSLTDGSGNSVTGLDLTFDNTNVACFVRGTQIATRRGSVAIEDLKVGDEVITMDHGFQKIRWIGSTSVPATGALAPVVIRKGAMGNERDLRVSPQHRMLVRGWHVELMFGQKEALVPAKALINDETVFPLEGGTVDYFHMMFDRHELVYAEGVPSESFHPGHVGLGSFAEDTREEILTLFPELRADAGSYSEHVRPSLKVREAKVLAENPELLKE